MGHGRPRIAPPRVGPDPPPLPIAQIGPPIARSSSLALPGLSTRWADLVAPPCAWNSKSRRPLSQGNDDAGKDPRTDPPSQPILGRERRPLCEPMTPQQPRLAHPDRPRLAKARRHSSPKWVMIRHNGFSGQGLEWANGVMRTFESGCVAPSLVCN